MATNPARDEPAAKRSERRSATPEEKLDEALKLTFPASDAFVVPWEPRALDVRQAD